MLPRPFSLLPVKVVPYDPPWLVDFEFKTWELLALLYTAPRPNDTWISFAIAYRLRWMEQARQDSKGIFWLINGKSIRTPMHLWVRGKGLYVYFKNTEITFPHKKVFPF
jgi:hypothetical protein